MLESITIPTLIIGIDSDRFFPLAGQKRLAAHIPGNINGDEPALLESDFGHDAFLIESEFVGAQISRLLAT